MHQHHVDMFNGLEAGLQLREYAYGGGGVSAPSPTRTTVLHQRETKTDGKTKSMPVTPTDQAKEAIKDGRISKAEKTAFDKTPVTKEIVKDEQKRLAEAVKTATGSDHLRDKDGKLVLRDGKPTPAVNYAGGRGYAPVNQPTKHEQAVADLKESKDGNADQIKTRIEQLKADGVSASELAPLEKKRDERLAAEGKVADVIVDKTAYVGTLEAEKAELTSATGTQEQQRTELRTKAQDALERFIKHDGQVHEPDVFGDDWDNRETEDPEKLFNDLAKKFKDEPKLLDQWVSHQGDQNDGVEDWDKHLSGIDDPNLYDKVLGRKQAAEELTSIFKQYNAADSDASSERIEQIDAEIGIVNDSIKADREVLSSETTKALDAKLAPVDGIIPSEPVVADRPGKTAPGTPSGSNGTENTNGQGGDNPVDKPAEPVKIDYTKPEAQKQVIAKAQEANLLPAENVTFNGKGEAQYKVQSGDSYWRIADMSDGKAPHEFDSQHFTTMLTDNSARLNRDPQVGMLYVDDEVVIPGRNVQDLVKLLNLPLTEKPVEETN
ncbi:MAG: hypothetical protein JWM86_652 [Thermoleophilia bacterium]|nr:hypothetical protein [Thermoleophilia bacterium]